MIIYQYEPYACFEHSTVIISDPLSVIAEFDFLDHWYIQYIIAKNRI